eukprot:TRINITY_DN79315_c0_g1_i1.p1 TRINITY_DN79315_c0_g1~~TRINITY_DN79315_c0_g1_i1.p1  ORF type:complete len:677 (-),score=126.76 TRINITY_DN79315_c0_g1_i1:7-1998(-)
MAASSRWRAATLLLALRALAGPEGGASQVTPAARRSWNGCDMSRLDLSSLVLRARAYYKHGLFELADSERLARILQDRESILEICPAAVLQAILLKLEENLVYQSGAYEGLMSQYTKILQQAVRQGMIGAVDFDTWPLDEGIDRTFEVVQRLGDRRRLTSAMVMNYCQVVDRFGASHELGWLLEAPFGDPELVTSENGDVGLLKDTDLYIYQVDWPWCKPPSEAVLSKVRGAVRELHVVHYRGGPRREEQTAYFKFILDHWDNLPDFTIFVHPDANEHQGSAFLALRRALKLINTQSQFAYDSIGYHPLAQQLVIDPKRTWGKPFASTWRHFWHRVFGHPWREFEYVPPRCKWVKHEGFYLSGHVEGVGTRQTLLAAKTSCALHGDDCAGVTCRSPLDPFEAAAIAAGTLPAMYDRLGGHTCTPRIGKDGLQKSPESQEVTYMKSCAAAGSSGHEDAELLRDAQQNEVGATYLRREGTFLLSYAADDDAIRDERGARARCDELGIECTGYTCDKIPEVSAETTKKAYAEDQASQACTVRGGTELMPSPSGELTYVKVPPAESREEAARRPPVRDDATAVFQFYTGSQSIVRKDRLKWWPREEVQAFAEDGVWCSDTTGLFEAVWHRMFGEPLSQYTRERDPSLPLYLKWEVPTMLSFGDEGVI